MKFFLPGAKDDKATNESYIALKAFLKSNGYETLEKHIYKIKFAHEGKDHHAVIGEACSFNKETTIAILESERVYLICTPSRGIKAGGHVPIMVGKDADTEVVFFDNP